MNEHMHLGRLLHGVKKSKLEYIAHRLSAGSPLNTALIHSAMDRVNGDLVVEIVTAEIRQLKIWFDSSREYDAWACTLVCEKLEMVFEIVEELKRTANYLVIGKILVEIMNLLLYFLGNTVEADVEVDIFLKRSFEELSLWDEAKIPTAEKDALGLLFNDQTLLKTLDGYGYDSALQKAVSGWLTLTS